RPERHRRRHLPRPSPRLDLAKSLAWRRPLGVGGPGRWSRTSVDYRRHRCQAAKRQAVLLHAIAMLPRDGRRFGRVASTGFVLADEDSDVTNAPDPVDYPRPQLRRAEWVDL